MLGKRRRLAILAEGHFNATDAKSAVGVLRYRPEEVAAVIDSTRAGATAQACAGAGGNVPVVADVAAAAACGADALLIGIAPQGGGLPEAWRATVAEALARGWDVVSGLHVFLADDPRLAALAAAGGGAILDVRRPPAARPIATRRAMHAGALVALTVGSDCNVGKMTAALEVRAELERMGVRAAFVATGQTGIFIADRGTAVDAVVSDFVAGVVENMVVEAAADADIVLVEGQGTLHHPAYSGVTLSLLHGACPEVMLLCHQPGRERIRSGDPADAPAIRPLGQLVRDFEAAAGWVRESRVCGVALNTMHLPEDAARCEAESLAAQLALPVTDPVRFGARPLAAALVERLEHRRRHAAAR